jgi:phage shock protein A
LSALTPAVNPSDAWARFEKFHRQIELAQAESLAHLDLEQAHADWSLEMQFDERAVQRDIDDELTRLKTAQRSAAQ